MARREIYFPYRPQDLEAKTSPSYKNIIAEGQKYDPKVIREMLVREKRITSAHFPLVEPLLLERVISWFDADSADPLKAGTLRAARPHVEIVEFTNKREHGLYKNGTRFIGISHLLADDIVRLMHAVSHELNHLGSFEIGGKNYTMGDKLDRYDVPAWLDEGLTEWANRTIMQRNLSAKEMPISYDAEVRIVNGIAKITGRERLLRAIRTKNLHEVMNMIDTEIREDFCIELLEGFDSSREFLVELNGEAANFV